MSRRYSRRRSKDNSWQALGILVCVLIAVAYYSLSSVQKVMVIIALVLLLVLGALWVLKRREDEQKKLRALEMLDIAHMDGLAFEKYVAEIMKSRGYSHVTLTEYYDWGVDIIAEKDNVRWGVQVKRYTGVVKAEAVRQVVAGLNKYGCSRAMVVTNSTYSRPARVLAESNNCVLVDMDELANWMVVFQNKQVNR